MDLAVNYKILVAEDFCLLNYEIRTLLKKHGFSVIEMSGNKDFQKLIEDQSPDVIITCYASLKKLAVQENVFKSLFRDNMMADISDTIVFDGNMNPLVRYPKPFNSNDMINYIVDMLTGNKVSQTINRKIKNK